MNLEFFELLSGHYHSFRSQGPDLIASNLLSPFCVPLPAALLAQAKTIVGALYQLREDPIYQNWVRARSPEIAAADPGNKSICMSYDFHISADMQKLQLIEVNTNAAFLLLGYHMYELLGHALPVADFSPKELIANVQTEIRLSKPSLSGMPELRIVDEMPETQRLFAEFLAFNDLFSQNGISSRICGVDALEQDKIDFIYNRSTDFYLSSKVSSRLSDLYRNHKACLSPNPFEYSLLADKQRLIDWSLERDEPWCSHLTSIRKYLLSANHLDATTSEQIWKDKKTYFLKPLQSFGSKQTYRGQSISKGIFQQATQTGDFIAQQFCPAPSFKVRHLEQDLEFKYDLRFFVYQSRVQLVLARVYQGQVTNLRTPLGGFACVNFS